jgi:hypothetical protein
MWNEDKNKKFCGAGESASEIWSSVTNIQQLLNARLLLISCQKTIKQMIVGVAASSWSI